MGWSKGKFSDIFSKSGVLYERWHARIVRASRFEAWVWRKMTVVTAVHHVKAAAQFTKANIGSSCMDTVLQHDE